MASIVKCIKHGAAGDNVTMITCDTDEFASRDFLVTGAAASSVAALSHISWRAAQMSSQ